MSFPLQLVQKGFMGRTPASSQRALFAAIAVVVAGFLLSSVYSQRVLGRVHTAAGAISRDKAPSVEHLAAARADMHQLEMSLRDFVSGAPTVNVSQIQAYEHRLQADLASYVSLPTDEDEQGFVKSLEQKMGDLREETGEVVARAQGRDVAGATAVIRDRMRLTIDDARELILADIALNARQARDEAAQIDRLRAQSAAVTYTLDGIVTALAVVVAWVTGQMLRRSARLAEEAAERERVRASELDMFAARVAHDLISPLAPASLSFDLLSNRCSHDERAQELIVKGRGALQRVRALVDDLLTFARSGAKGSLEARADVRRTVHEVIEELESEAAGAEVQLVGESVANVVVQCPAVLLSDVLRNLIRNAIRHMGDSTPREVRVRALPRFGKVQIEVEDTGPGVPPGLESRIFEPYVQGDPSSKGLGLGLATVRRIVEAHEGEVGVRNRPEGGAVFWVVLNSKLSESEPVVAH